MGASSEWLIGLARAGNVSEDLVGGKAAGLGRLGQAGWTVAPGFVISTAAYAHFLAAGDLERTLRMELGRKPLDGMRWEEIWDTALRIRSAFLATDIPADLAAVIGEAVAGLGAESDLVVRSSAPCEDSRDTSFAGLHESLVGVRGEAAALDAVRIVWASLWSDAALLYRRELALDPAHSRMAVLVQPLVAADRSGVAFARDPRLPARDVMVIEAVPGLCRDLVDGTVDPDRWLLRRTTGEVKEVRLGERGAGGEAGPLLDAEDLGDLHGTVLDLERELGWPPDVEWTGRRRELVILQARPITSPRPAATADAGDKRPWYLSLRPADGQLRRLCRRVSEELIPALEAEGARMAAQNLSDLDDPALAAVLEEREEALRRWQRIYWRDFIPFAHGVRRLAVYYNDAVRPDDPYEFVGLLDREERLASRRNRELMELAELLRTHGGLTERLTRLAAAAPDRLATGTDLQADLTDVEGGEAFCAGFGRLLREDLDIAFGGARLSDHPVDLLRVAMKLAAAESASARELPRPADSRRQLEERLLTAVGESRQDEAREVLAIGRLSWRLRDDDNLLVGRLESQLLRAAGEAVERLLTVGRVVPGAAPLPEHAALLAQALTNPAGGILALPEPEAPRKREAELVPGVSARQLTGQPGAPGLARGPARCIRSQADLAAFQAGEVLVCDAIQPTMTHLVPLACAVVERRGGMLIHGVIIARELGLPCVNGITGLLDRVRDGDLLTVDGFLGIVTVGEPDLDLELDSPPAANP